MLIYTNAESFPTSTQMESHRSLTTLPSEILTLILSNLSDDDILHLPVSVIQRGLTISAAKARYWACTISLDRPGLEQIYHLCSIPSIVSTNQHLTILTDRVVAPSKKEYLSFQHARPKRMEKLPRQMTGCHGLRNWEQCPICNGLSPQKQEQVIQLAAKIQTQVESSSDEKPALDLTMLVYALSRMEKLESVSIKSTPERKLHQLRAERESKQDEVERRIRLIDGIISQQYRPVPECWDMQLDRSRINVLLLQAMITAKRKVGWCGIPCVSSLGLRDDYWACWRGVLMMEKRELEERVEKGKGKVRDPHHAYRIWDECLRRCPSGVEAEVEVPAKREVKRLRMESRWEEKSRPWKRRQMETSL